MKHLLTLLFSLVALHAFAHEGVDLGPNGGRLLVIDKKTDLKGEILVKGDQFHLTLLDKDLKPLPPGQHTLTASSRSSVITSTKLSVGKDGKGFTIPVIGTGSWLVLQHRSAPDAKPSTIRLRYDTSICSGCQKAEWLCGCQ